MEEQLELEDVQSAFVQCLEQELEFVLENCRYNLILICYQCC